MPMWIWLGAGGCALFAAWALRVWVTRLVDRRIARFQSELIARHCDEVQNIYREMRGWRHDYHNHIQAMKAYRALALDEQLDAYLAQLDADLSGVDKMIKSGNVTVDAILNSKLSLAKARDIVVHAKATVPERLTVSEVDLCVILGNLLDNAMEACARVKPGEAKVIRVYIDRKRDQLYISITNTASGRPEKQAGRYMTRKQGSHGFGLLRIDRLIEKYAGYMKRRDEEGAFSTEILLPL